MQKGTSAKKEPASKDPAAKAPTHTSRTTYSRSPVRISDNKLIGLYGQLGRMLEAGIPCGRSAWRGRRSTSNRGAAT